MIVNYDIAIHRIATGKHKYWAVQVYRRGTREPLSIYTIFRSKCRALEFILELHSPSFNALRASRIVRRLRDRSAPDAP